MVNSNIESTSASGLNKPSRRDVVRGAAALGAAMAIPSFVHAAGNDTLKVGLIGCGGRGTGAANNALNADPNLKIIALGDMFPDKLETSLLGLHQSQHKDRVEVSKEHQFTGWDAYKGVIELCDVVLLATPPHFRPMHLKAVIDAGKHVFCEKPVATDAPGLRSVIETAAKAKEKKLSLVSGLCYRYDEAKIETVKRIHDGGVGDIINLNVNYLTTGLWSNARKPEWSDMEWQLRNWLYYTWLSGDLITEQHIHSLDKMMWVMKDETPAFAVGNGGRACRTEAAYGNVYDHFNTMYEWSNGVRCFASARQWNGCFTDVSDWVYGNKGVANIMNHTITGENKWKRKASPKNMYDLEHIALYKSIQNNEPINNGDYMVKSTGVAIMGRMAAYTGTKVTYEQMMTSEENLAPMKYEFGPLEFAPIAVPGKTKLL